MPVICTDQLFYVSQVMNGLRSGNDSDTALRWLWARGEADNNICRVQGNGDKTAELIGTAFVARDMMHIVDALGEDGMLRYWGDEGTAAESRLGMLTGTTQAFPTARPWGPLWLPCSLKGSTSWSSTGYRTPMNTTMLSRTFIRIIISRPVLIATSVPQRLRRRTRHGHGPELLLFNLRRRRARALCPRRR